MKCVVCESNKLTILFSHHKDWKIGKCSRCGLVQVAPMPSQTEINALYHEDMEHFEPYIDQMEVHKLYFRKKIDEIGFRIYDLGFRNNTSKRFLNRKSYIVNRKLLDIGCAMGALLAEATKVGYKADGVDISKDAVGYCKKQGFTVYNGTVQGLGKTLKSGSYDVVTAFQIIEHERDPLTMMKRIYNLLNHDGMVVLATPNYGGFWRRVMGKRWFGFRHPEHVVLLDFQSMRILLEKAGFRDIEIRKDSPRPFPLSFAFTRGADYFPFLAFILRPMGKLLDGLKVTNPINPWDDMIVFARK